MILKALTWLKMFIMFRFFVIYFIILGYTNTLPINHDGRTTLSLERQVESEMSPFNQIIQFLKNPPKEELSTKLLDLGKQLQIKLEMLLRSLLRFELEMSAKDRELGRLETEQKYTKENMLLNTWRLLIGDYEESFPQVYEDDFEKKKVKYDASKFTDLRRSDLIEERRRQKWLFYCNNPPNKRITDLVTTLNNENVNLDTFSRGIAKAYRLLSDKFLTGFRKVYEGDFERYYMFKEVVIAMRMLLKHEGILDELIEQCFPNHLDQN